MLINKSNWMETILSTNTCLNNIHLPGSHDSGTYNISKDSLLSKVELQEAEEKREIFELTQQYNNTESFLSTLIAPLSKAQNRDIYSQLLDGIRYFDFRPCKKEDEIWISHSLYSINIDSILRDVKRFVDQNPKEIIIMDYRFMWGFSEKECKVLFNKINITLGKRIAGLKDNFSMQSKIEDFWAKNKNIIILFQNSKFKLIENQKNNEILYKELIWNSSENFSRIENSDNKEKTAQANIQNIENNYEKLSTSTNLKNIQCQITPLFNNLVSITTPLESLAISNKDMIKYIKERWSKKSGFIYTFDFYNNCDVVEDIIKLNMDN